MTGWLSSAARPAAIDAPLRPGHSGVSAAWNMTALDEDDARKAYEALEFQADACRGCGHCEERRAHIPVSSVMKQMAEYFQKKKKEQRR